MVVFRTMSVCTTEHPRHTGNLYGAFAFGIVVLSCYASFLAPQRYYGSEWMVLVVVALGAVYSVLGILGAAWIDQRGKAYGIYFGLQCTVVTLILLLTPVRGYVGILVLPLVSQAIFDLRPLNSVVVTIYLFGINIGLWSMPFTWQGATRALFNYAAAFVFTIVFTLITKQALIARSRAEALRLEVEKANQQLRDHAAQTEELATTRERNRVAREIHDGVGHYLTVVKTQLDAAAALLPAQPERAREAVTKAARLTSDALADVRRSVGALRSDAVHLPLAQALRALGDEAGLSVAVRVEGEARVLPPAVEHALYRAAQEGLTNVRKHASASSAEVVLDFRNTGQVKVSVLDDGKGARESISSQGFGLLGIRERVEMMGGRVASGNRPSGGFALTVEVPA